MDIRIPPKKAQIGNRRVMTRDQIKNLNHLKDQFDSNFYIKAYKDVKQSDNDPFNHYCAYGILEDRLPNAARFSLLYPEFDQQIYIVNNNDLGTFTTEELMSHFHHHGRHEKRIHMKQQVIEQKKSIILSDPPQNHIPTHVPTNVPTHAPTNVPTHVPTHLPTQIQMQFNSQSIQKKSLPNVIELNQVNEDHKSTEITETPKKDKNKERAELIELQQGLTSDPSLRKYLDEENLKKIADGDLYNQIDIEIDDKLMRLISDKDYEKPIYLVLAEWGYPPFGGGECWLIDTMKWMTERGFSCYYIYFSDHSKNKVFDRINIISSQYGYFIQFPPQTLQLLKFIKLLNPTVISNQGLNRMKYMKIANVLEKPFITGFCFWHDLLQMSDTPGDVFNQNMINKTLVGDENFKVIYNNSAACYVCGQFVGDIVKKVHNIDLNVINTIADESHYQIDNQENNIYVTVVNICGLKGGYILEDIINNTSKSIPFYLIDSQNSADNVNQRLEQLIISRNSVESVKSIYHKGSVPDIKAIYKKTKILLIPSLVDETFCRVAYEGMMNGIPILSTRNGNLKYLMDGYADFLDEDPKQWSSKINQIYADDDYLNMMRRRQKSIDRQADKNKFEEQIYQSIANKSSDYFNVNNIGIFCPWADQGLGIQCREYYDILHKNGYNVSIFSFKPYHSTKENPRMQTDYAEWDYKNIYYTKSLREEVSIEEFLDYIHQYKIKKIIIVETCYNKIFEIAKLCKLLSIQVIGIPNLETMRYSEVYKHHIFDKIVCNNTMTYDILSKYFPRKVDLLGFRILNKNFANKKHLQGDHNSLFCCGGLNALTRKNIDKVMEAFKELEIEKKIKNFKLYVYIQGVEVPQNINKYASDNIIIKVGAKSYKEIAQLYKDHDIFVHMGDHEGLGLGFYESLACGTPVFTIDTPPNNEIIKEGHNGWLVKCDYGKLTDNNEGIVKKAMISSRDIKSKLTQIINGYNRQEMHISTIKDYIKRYPLNNYSEGIRRIFG